jgi:hypothetical protein
MAVNTDTRYNPVVARNIPITGPNGLMEVGMPKKTQSVADSVKKFFTSPGGYVLTGLTGCAVICLSACLIGGTLGGGIAVAAALAVIVYIAVCNPFSHRVNSDEVEVERIKKLFDESFKCCKTAWQTVENAQQSVSQGIVSPKIIVGLEGESRVPFGANCNLSESKIGLLCPKFDQDYNLSPVEYEKLLRALLFESINLYRLKHTYPNDIAARAGNEIYIDEITREKKIGEYVKELEKWEIGTVFELLEVWENILNEMGSQNIENHPEKQFWKSIALKQIKSAYQFIIDDAWKIANHQVNNSALASAYDQNRLTIKRTKLEQESLRNRINSTRMSGLMEQYRKATTFKEINDVLKEIESDPAKLKKSYKKVIKESVRSSGHTAAREPYFRGLVPGKPETKPVGNQLAS